MVCTKPGLPLLPEVIWPSMNLLPLLWPERSLHEASVSPSDGLWCVFLVYVMGWSIDHENAAISLFRLFAELVCG